MPVSKIDQVKVLISKTINCHSKGRIKRAIEYDVGGCVGDCDLLFPYHIAVGRAIVARSTFVFQRLLKRVVAVFWDRVARRIGCLCFGGPKLMHE